MNNTSPLRECVKVAEHVYRIAKSFPHRFHMLIEGAKARFIVVAEVREVYVLSVMRTAFDEAIIPRNMVPLSGRYRSIVRCTQSSYFITGIQK